jgi:hypothetical protein
LRDDGESRLCRSFVEAQQFMGEQSGKVSLIEISLEEAEECLHLMQEEAALAATSRKMRSAAAS